MRSVTVQADIYSLGVILYELVTGRPPFEADNQHDIMAAHCTQEPRFPRGMDSQVRMVCERCLRKNPTERYRSLYALERDLRTIARLDEPEPDELPWTWIVSGVGLVIFSLLLWLMHDQLADGLRLWWNG
jgi:serine/threonine protein kinase